MNRDEEYQDVSNRAKLDLSEVAWYRLARANEDGNSSGQARHQPDEITSGPTVFEEADRICQSKTKVVIPEQPPEIKPHHMSSVAEESDNSMEGYWKLEVRTLKKSVTKLERSRKILNAFCVALLFLFAINLALFGKNYWGVKSSQTPSQDGVVEAKALIIRGQNGHVHAYTSERDGKFWLEIRDGAGKAQAGISLAARGEPKIFLSDKDQKKLAEWKNVAAETAVTENSDKATASPAIPESVSSPQEIVTPVRYIGSKTSNKYHYPECEWGKQIIPEKLIGFHSVKEAQDNGYVQCKACRPPLRDMPE